MQVTGFLFDHQNASEVVDMLPLEWIVCNRHLIVPKAFGPLFISFSWQALVLFLVMIKGRYLFFIVPRSITLFGFRHPWNNLINLKSYSSDIEVHCREYCQSWYRSHKTDFGLLLFYCSCTHTIYRNIRFVGAFHIIKCSVWFLNSANTMKWNENAFTNPSFVIIPLFSCQSNRTQQGNAFAMNDRSKLLWADFTTATWQIRLI
jgi:hypothetical protein